jgi:hypothetical protein
MALDLDYVCSRGVAQLGIAHSLGVREVGSSNLLAPTILFPEKVSAEICHFDR